MSETKVQRYGVKVLHAADGTGAWAELVACDGAPLVKAEDHEKAIAEARAEGERAGLRRAAEYLLRASRDDMKNARKTAEVTAPWAMAPQRDFLMLAKRGRWAARIFRKVAREVKG